ncbi:tyrosine-type recombinase/integrase [Streptomyces sp. NPDC056656]|uniref:tyrosine-type recombinase/integrase n=1 Tax=Streptomyces sp. NPDC056656 TaxID=3345895 RepID=UPI0036BD1919
MAGRRGGALGSRPPQGCPGVYSSRGRADAVPELPASRLGQGGETAGPDGLDLTPHKLRHTAAFLDIAAGADVKVVQTMLGHKSAAMTLDVYGHLWPDQPDEVADVLDAGRAAALATLRAPIAPAEQPNRRVRNMCCPPG